MTKKHTQESILELFRQVHGDKYDYSLFKYTTYKDKSTIICPIHREFPKSPAKHIAGQGCPDCSVIERIKKRSLSPEQAIQKGVDLFGDKFDYSEMQYINQNTIVKITCKIHNHSFDIKPQDHWYSVHGGCKLCDSGATSDRKRYTIEDFIAKASAIHQGIYDYSEVIYVKDDLEVIIKCPKHSVTFKQKPKYHLRGQISCKQCEQDKRSLARLKELSTFIKEANQVHQYKYDYSFFEYTGCHNSSTIICPIHKDFKKNPVHHLRGQGCPECSKIKRGDKTRKTQESFIAESKAIHKDSYDYSLVRYVNNSTPVDIICNSCGTKFPQRPSDHLQGKGCKKCNSFNTFSRSQYIELCDGRTCIFYIILVHNDFESFYKLGITINSVARRYSCETDMPYEYDTVLIIKGDPGVIFDLEREVKSKLTNFIYQPKLSFPGSKTECYLNYEDIYDVLRPILIDLELKDIDLEIEML